MLLGSYLHMCDIVNSATTRSTDIRRLVVPRKARTYHAGGRPLLRSDCIETLEARFAPKTSIVGNVL